MASPSCTTTTYTNASGITNDGHFVGVSISMSYESPANLYVVKL
ncbi:hypothetical protein ACFSKX_12010 [Microbulbifer halophilus]|uniref:Uncharacterized protein n=1 Tax=Microbulbifer halophilus TaxID=453963 RepID=A0ABW5ED50_9GAMM